MSGLDYAVMLGTLLFIVIYGTLKTRKSMQIEGYFLGDNSLKWGTIGLLLLSSHARPLPLLSTPLLRSGTVMPLVQNNLGLPISLLIVSPFFSTIDYKLIVFVSFE